MPEDMKSKMARLRAMRKPKKGGKVLECTRRNQRNGPSSLFTDAIFGENTEECRRKQREEDRKELFRGVKRNPNAFTREDWNTMMPAISVINPAFGGFLNKLLVLDDFDKGKISTKELAIEGAKMGFEEWIQPKIVSAAKDAATKYLAKFVGGKRRPRRGKRGGSAPAQASPFFNWLFNENNKFPDSGKNIKQREDSPFERAVGLTTEGQNTFTSDEVNVLIPIVKKISPELGKYIELLQKGKKFVEEDVVKVADELELSKDDLQNLMNKALEEYIDLFEDNTGFPDSLAEPNAARRGDSESKGQIGLGQNGLAGDPSTNPRPKEYVIPVKQINSYTSKGDNRGAMSGFKAIGQSPNASSFASVSF